MSGALVGAFPHTVTGRGNIRRAGRRSDPHRQAWPPAWDGYPDASPRRPGRRASVRSVPPRHRLRPRRWASAAAWPAWSTAAR